MKVSNHIRLLLELLSYFTAARHAS